MGFRFRKSIKLAPGVRLNVTKKGISSLSIGKRGATINVGKKGTRGTVGLNGTGLSYSAYHAHHKTRSTPSARNPYPETDTDAIQIQHRKIGIWLGIGIVIVPIIFAWFTLRQGYSTLSRVISMAWLLISLFALR